MEILFLGTSCAVPTAENGNSSFIVCAGKHNILFEAGNDPVRGMMKAGIDPLSVNIVVLSHYHADHVTSFPGMLSTFSCMNRQNPLTVLAPEETIRRITSICGLLSLDNSRISFDVHYTSGLKEDDLSLILHSAHHTVPSAMVLCRADEESILYSGDTAFHQDIGILGKGCKALIHDATTNVDKVAQLPGHSCPYEAGLSAKAAGVDTLFLTHICYDAFEKPIGAVEEAQRVFSGNVLIPELLKRYTV